MIIKQFIRYELVFKTNFRYYPIISNGFYILFNNPENDFRIKNIIFTEKEKELEYIIKSELSKKKEQKAIYKNNTGISERFQKNLNVLMVDLKTKKGNYFGKKSEEKYEQIFLNEFKIISSDNESEKK